MQFRLVSNVVGADLHVGVAVRVLFERVIVNLKCVDYVTSVTVGVR